MFDNNTPKVFDFLKEEDEKAEQSHDLSFDIEEFATKGKTESVSSIKTLTVRLLPNNPQLSKIENVF